MYIHIKLIIRMGTGETRGLPPQRPRLAVRRLQAYDAINTMSFYMYTIYIYI